VAEPVRQPRPPRGGGEGLGLVHRVPDLHDHQARTSFLGALGDEDLWAAFEQIGIDGLHTGPVKKAGGILGWESTPSVDGHFDRISTSIDDAFGTEEEFRTMCEVAASHLGLVLDDIVPGHTGKGADFRLAEMKIGDYPGIYHMVEIDEKDWHLLPTVSRGRDSVNLDSEAEDQLAKHGYIIGRMQRVIFYEPGVKDTNWSVTAPVEGPDGVGGAGSTCTTSRRASPRSTGWTRRSPGCGW
jgi:trehalose synthase